jgi:hypothetical protein
VFVFHSVLFTSVLRLETGRSLEKLCLLLVDYWIR